MQILFYLRLVINVPFIVLTNQINISNGYPIFDKVSIIFETIVLRCKVCYVFDFYFCKNINVIYLKIPPPLIERS